MISKDSILAEIRRTAEANAGVSLGARKFLTETGIRDSDWGRYWPRWSEAVREAGHTPNDKKAAYSSTAILEKLVGFIREIGRFPVVREIKLKRRSDPTFPSHNVFRRCFADQNSMIAAVLEYCSARAGYEDIVQICGPALQQHDGAATEKRPAEEPIGFVYLLRSGKYYKMGKTNAAGRRERELAIQLPEKVKTVHVIRTDDPTGIEKYWHDRFQAKRKNGEWFDLDAADVTAFRRRKFM